MKSDRNYSPLIYLLIPLITIAAFWGIHNYEFINLDDPAYVTSNPNVQAGLTAKAVRWAFTQSHAGYWHPVTWLSHMVDCGLYGLNPGGHHVTNLLIHILSSLVLFWILKTTTRALWPSAFVAFVFAIHPLRIESVVWIAERKDVLCALFFLLTIAAYVLYCRRPGFLRYAAVFILYGFGLMSKPMAVTLPFVLLLLDYWPLERWLMNEAIPARKSKSAKKDVKKFSFSYLIVEKTPLFALTAVSSIIAFIVQRQAGAMETSEPLSLSIRLANAFISCLTYLQKTFWPNPLAPFYPHPGQALSMTHAIASAVVLLAITALIVRFSKTHKYAAVGWFWFIGMLVPVIGLVQVGDQAYADRFTYLPITGLFILIAWSVPPLLAKWRFKNAVLAASSAAIIAALSLVTYFQQHYWRDSITLFEHAIKVTEGNYVAHFGLADPLRAKGRLEEAMNHAAQCLALRPNHKGALNSMGLALIDAGRNDEAIGYFERALKVQPDSQEARINLGIALAKMGNYDEAIVHYQDVIQKYNAPAARYNLAYALRRKGDYDGAIREYKIFLQSDPSNALVHYAIGFMFAEQGKGDESAAYLQKATEIKPDFLEAHESLGRLFAAQRKFDRAIRHFSEALRIAPGVAELHFNLGYVYAAQGQLELAAMEYETVIGMQPNNYIAHDHLGTVLAKLGRAQEALQHFRYALKINPDYTEARINLQSLQSQSP